MIVIGAMAENRVIGKGDGMPWDVPEEYRHFQDLIAGQTIIIGRRSYEIFRADLTSAYNVVVTRSVTRLAGAVVVPSIEEAIHAAASLNPVYFSAGGATIYAQTIPLADTMYLSYIKGAFDGDTYFPPFDEGDWQIDRRDEHPRFDFVVYRRVVPGIASRQGP
jgi:dihydrofolate reductase